VNLKKYQIALLWICLGLFGVRVLAQLYVAIYSVPWLPPMEEWYSGLIPYHFLFPAQISLLMFMTVLSYDNSLKQGYFYVLQPRTKAILKQISLVYFVTMLVRHIIYVAFEQPGHWFNGFIPVFFHWVLAAYLFVLTQDSQEKSGNKI